MQAVSLRQTSPTQAITENNIVLKENINGLDVQVVFGVYKVAAEGAGGGLPPTNGHLLMMIKNIIFRAMVIF
jgi:hypothetical protein